MDEQKYTAIYDDSKRVLLHNYAFKNNSLIILFTK